VNRYRLEELQQSIREHPEYTSNTLAELCGFGSTDSLKRAVRTSFGMSYSEWRKSLPGQADKHQDNLNAKA
jgi:AraC-like DNA-binding protein